MDGFEWTPLGEEGAREGERACRIEHELMARLNRQAERGRCAMGLSPPAGRPRAMHVSAVGYKRVACRLEAS